MIKKRLPKEGVPQTPLPEKPETLEGRRIEIVQEIRERHGILHILAQPNIEDEKLGFAPGRDRRAYTEALGLPMDTQRIRTINASEERLPDTIEESGIIIGGSAHSVYEDLPWIRRLEEFIRIIAAQNKPMLGVCFGDQLIVQALGGKVEKAPQGSELGVFNIDLNQKGIKDRLFHEVPTTFPNALSHFDAVTALPQLKKVAVLAETARDKHTALALGELIRTVQFHPEIDRPVIKQLVIAMQDALIAEGLLTKEELVPYLKKIAQQDIETIGRQIIQNFNRHFVVRYHQKRKT